MNTHTINPSITMVFIFCLCLLIPRISVSETQIIDSQNNSNYSQPTIQQIDTSIETSKPVNKKEILSTKRELGGFFTIGLIINVIMITTFFIWAVGQWRKSSDHSKPASK